MILADKISELRKKSGWSQEELAEMLEVSRQSISKWESAQATPDMNRILKMANLFNVSTDMLLRDDLELSLAAAPVAAQAEACPRAVSMEEAVAFLSYREMAANRIALGVMMCVLSPILVILLTVFQKAGRLKMPSSAAIGLGLTALLLLVGGAVVLFVSTGLKGERFEYLEKEEIDTAYGVDGMVKERREQYRSLFSTQLVVGILLCVISAVPLFVMMIGFGENNVATSIGAALLLAFVAVGCLLIIRAATVWGSFQILLQEKEYTVAHKAENRSNEALSAVYWGLAVAIYLTVSFITKAWTRTWIVWPIAGVTYGVVLAVARLLRRKQ